MQRIADYTDILENKKSMAKVIINDLKAIKKEYAEPRRTEIDNVAEAVIEEKPIEEEDVVVLLDKFAYGRCVDVATYERNKEAAEEESKKIIFCKNLDKLAIFTNTGQMHLLKVLDLPMGKFRDKGQHIDNVSNFNSAKEDVLYIEALGNLKGKRVFFGTKMAMIKLVPGEEFDVAKRTTAATKLLEGDKVRTVGVIDKDDTVVMHSKGMYFLRIDGSTIPEKKKAAVGVRGMKLSEGDSLKGIVILKNGENPLVKVKGKSIQLNRLHIANRDTRGVKK